MRRVKSSTVPLPEFSRQAEPSDRLSRLQQKVLFRILQYLHAQDLLSLGACNRFLYHKSSDNDLWICFCEKEGVYLHSVRNSRSPNPLRAFSEKLRSVVSFGQRLDDSDIPHGHYRRAYLKVLYNWAKNKSNSTSYNITQRKGTVVRGEYILAWSNSDVAIISKRTKNVTTVNVSGVEATSFFDGSTKFVVFIPSPEGSKLNTYRVEDGKLLNSYSFSQSLHISLADCLHISCVAISGPDKVNIYDLNTGTEVHSTKVVKSSNRFVEYDGFRVVTCARDSKKLQGWNLRENTVREVDQCTDFKVLSDIKQVIVFYVRWKCEIYNVDTMIKLQSVTPSCGDFADVHVTLHYRARTLVGLMGGPPGTGTLFPVVSVWNLTDEGWIDKGIIMRGHVTDVGFVSSHLFLCETRKSDRSASRFQLWHVRKASLVANVSLPLDCNSNDRSLDPKQLNASTVAVVTKEGVVGTLGRSPSDAIFSRRPTWPSRSSASRVNRAWRTAGHVRPKSWAAFDRPSSCFSSMEVNVEQRRLLQAFLFFSFFGVNSAGIGCFVCSSFNQGNPECEDMFNSSVSHSAKGSVANYQYPCWAFKKDRQGLFPADHCVKVNGYQTDDNSQTILIRTCALDSGTLTADTEIVRISHCGHFKYEGKQYTGCVQSCDTDGCNGVTGPGVMKMAVLVGLILASML
ncbi:unnamed protein product [Bursaphelenchus xylophilus]|uniref:(pine wood nematode) hypothetical protein n=1 Tax=Bursaphelenchus xylophilus TaxID=6326 RepID=A0A1I7RRQ0_BURXY|nr:unnamed protein product [Bursaphelenchus xylophilus]CAG9123566.1 unnamed protein product [Bursaphelenchus xylophilus]